MSVINGTSFVFSGADSYENENNPLICYDNIVTVSNLLASSEDADFPVSNAANPATDLIWKASSAALTTVDISNDADTVDYIGIVGHNFASAGIGVKIQVDTGSGYVDLTSETTPTDDGPLIFRLPSQVLWDTLRIRMAAGTAAPQFAVVYCGQSMVIQRRLYVGHTPISMGRSVAVVNGVSQTGNYLGAVIVGEVFETKIDIQNMAPGWYRQVLDPFIEVCKSTPFFFAWRPRDYPDEVGYCWVTNDPIPENQRPNGMMRIGISVRGIC